MDPPEENLYRSTNHLNDMASESAAGYHYVRDQGGLDAAARNTPDYAPSLTEEERTAAGAGADVAEANASEMTGDC